MSDDNSGWWDFENQARERGRALDPDITKLCDDGFEVIDSFYQATEGMSLPEKWEMAMVLAFVQATNSLRVAWELAFVGYYVQSLAAARLVSDYLALLMYFPTHPEEAKRWLDFRERAPDTAGDILQKVLKADSTGSQGLHSMRQVLNEFSHQNPIGLGFGLGPPDPESQKSFLYAGPNPIREAIKEVATFLIPFQTGVIREFLIWAGRKKPGSWVKPGMNYVDRATDWVKARNDEIEAQTEQSESST